MHRHIITPLKYSHLTTVEFHLMEHYRGIETVILCSERRKIGRSNHRGAKDRNYLPALRTQTHQRWKYLDPPLVL